MINQNNLLKKDIVMKLPLSFCVLLMSLSLYSSEPGFYNEDSSSEQYFAPFESNELDVFSLFFKVVLCSSLHPGDTVEIGHGRSMIVLEMLRKLREMPFWNEYREIKSGRKGDYIPQQSRLSIVEEAQRALNKLANDLCIMFAQDRFISQDSVNDIVPILKGQIDQFMQIDPFPVPLEQSGAEFDDYYPNFVESLIIDPQGTEAENNHRKFEYQKLYTVALMDALQQFHTELVRRAIANPNDRLIQVAMQGKNIVVDMSCRQQLSEDQVFFFKSYLMQLIGNEQNAVQQMRQHAFVYAQREENGPKAQEQPRTPSPNRSKSPVRGQQNVALPAQLALPLDGLRVGSVDTILMRIRVKIANMTSGDAVTFGQGPEKLVMQIFRELREMPFFAAYRNAQALEQLVLVETGREVSGVKQTQRIPRKEAIEEALKRMINDLCETLQRDNKLKNVTDRFKESFVREMIRFMKIEPIEASRDFENYYPTFIRSLSMSDRSKYDAQKDYSVALLNALQQKYAAEAERDRRNRSIFSAKRTVNNNNQAIINPGHSNNLLTALRLALSLSSY